MMRKKSITIKGHRTSIALEPAFWEELEKAAREEEKSLPVLAAEVDKRRITEETLAGACFCIAALCSQAFAVEIVRASRAKARK